MKDKIKQTSIRLFVEKGFMETSIQDIVDELQVTKGTFYYYYTSKEELLTDIHQEYIDSILAKQEELLSHDDWSWERKLYEIVYFLISDIERQGPSARIFHRELRNLSGERLQAIISKRDQFRYNIEHVLKMGAESGEFRRELKANIIALAVLGITNWSYEWFHPQGPLSAREVADLFFDMILNGIRSGEGADGGSRDFLFRLGGSDGGAGDDALRNTGDNRLGEGHSDDPKRNSADNRPSGGTDRSIGANLSSGGQSDDTERNIADHLPSARLVDGKRGADS